MSGIFSSSYGLAHWIFAYYYLLCSQKLAFVIDSSIKQGNQLLYQVLFYTFIFLNIAFPSYQAWGNKIEYKTEKVAAWVHLTNVGLDFFLNTVSCLVLSIALLRINSSVKKTNFISIDMTKLVMHLGSFVLFISSSLIGLGYNFVALEWTLY